MGQRITFNKNVGDERFAGKTFGLIRMKKDLLTGAWLWAVKDSDDNACWGVRHPESLDLVPLASDPENYGKVETDEDSIKNLVLTKPKEPIWLICRKDAKEGVTLFLGENCLGEFWFITKVLGTLYTTKEMIDILEEWSGDSSSIFAQIVRNNN